MTIVTDVETGKAGGTVTRVVHCGKEPYDVYIGRPTRWGNPFKIGVDGTRHDVIRKFREWFLARPSLVAEARNALRGKTLGCWCRPLACHGDVIAEIVDKERRDHDEQG